VGHLLLHLTGNLNYYVGAQIAGSGYVRDRPREFADTARRPKDEVLRDFDRAVDMVLATLAAQSEADWRAPYSGVGAEDVADRLAMFLRCAAHADHHAGQMIYLRKQVALSPDHEMTGGPLMASSPQANFGLAQIGQIAVPVADVARAIAFYRDV